MEITEYQIIRPSGAVLQSVLAPTGEPYSFDAEQRFGIRGPIVTRWRVLPSGPWTVVAYYPDGLGSTPVPWEATTL